MAFNQENQLPAVDSAPVSQELPDLSILTKSSCSPHVMSAEPRFQPAPEMAQPEGGPVKALDTESHQWAPVTLPGRLATMENGEASAELVSLRAEIRSLLDERKSLQQANKKLEQDKQDALRLAGSYERIKDELTEKNVRLDRENDDYLRSIVSANRKADFFEKTLREMRLRCQEQEDELRKHGLLKGLEGPAQPPCDDGLAALVTSLRSDSVKLETIMVAQKRMLNELVIQARKKSIVAVASPATKSSLFQDPVISISQGARQKTRPPDNTYPRSWQGKKCDIPTGHTTGEIVAVGTDSPRWMPADDRSMNACDKQFKEQRLDNWIRDLKHYPSTEHISSDDKDMGGDKLISGDYIFVTPLSNLPPSDPNFDCGTFPRINTKSRQGDQKILNAVAYDCRGSVAPVYDVKSFHYDNRSHHADVGPDDVRLCPVCDMHFAHIISTREYEQHVADCCERASNRDLASPASGPLISPPLCSPVIERSCPVCSMDFSTLAQEPFEQHVVAHFEDEATNVTDGC